MMRRSSRTRSVGGLPLWGGGRNSPDIGIDCDVLYGQLLRRMTNANDPSIRFAAIIRDDPRSVRAVTRVPAEVRGVLKIDIYAVALDGRVRQL